MPETEMLLAALTLDYDTFPRKRLDEVNVRTLVNAIERGETLPPLIVSDGVGEINAHIIVDGWHRHRAYEKSEVARVFVELRHYDSRDDMVRDAIRLNTARGLDLRPYDHARCLLLAEQYEIGDDELAGLLHVKTARLEKIRETRIGTTIGHKKLALKRSLSHLRGTPITPDIERLNDTASGMQPVFHVDQLIAFIEADALPDDEKLVVRLTRLGALIDEYLANRL